MSHKIFAEKKEKLEPMVSGRPLTERLYFYIKSVIGVSLQKRYCEEFLILEPGVTKIYTQHHRSALLDLILQAVDRFQIHEKAFCARSLVRYFTVKEIVAANTSCLVWDPH